MTVRIDAIELRRVCIPLVSPFRTSFGTDDVRDALLVRVFLSGGGEGWGECVADHEPLYSSEYVDSAAHVIRRFLAPRLFAHQRAAGGITPDDAAPVLARVQGHPMAKGAL